MWQPHLTKPSNYIKLPNCQLFPLKRIAFFPRLWEGRWTVSDPFFEGRGFFVSRMQWSPEDLALLASGYRDEFPWISWPRKKGCTPLLNNWSLVIKTMAQWFNGHLFFVIVWPHQLQLTSILQLRVRRFLESGWDEARSWHNFSILFVIGRKSIFFAVRWLGVPTFRYCYTLIYTIRIMAFQSFAISVAEFHDRLRLWDVAHEGLWWAFVEAAEQVRTKRILRILVQSRELQWPEWVEINYYTSLYLYNPISQTLV